MVIDLNYRFKKQNFIQSQKADPSPPLGTVLGNLGVNTVNFCTKFNSFTEKLPFYFLLKVLIYIYDINQFYLKLNYQVQVLLFIY